MIIDRHGHPGNPLCPGGGELILKKGVKKRFVIDLATLSKWQSHAGVPPALRGRDAGARIYKKYRVL